MEPTPPRFGLAAESIDGPGVRIRRYTDDDAADVQAGCDDPVTQRFLPQLPCPYTREDAIWWINEGSGVAFERGGGNFAIADPQTDRLLGGIGITHENNGNGEIGYWVAPWGRRRGVATAAANALTRYAFSAGYGRLHLRTEHANVASQRVAIGAGYRREGVQRGSALDRSGGRRDLIVWARLPDDPPGPAPRLLRDLPAGRLTDGVVTLRPLGPDDAAALHALRTTPDVAATHATIPRTLTAADTARICAHAGAHWLADARAHLSVREHDTGAFVGDIGLFDVNPGFGTAWLGYAIAPDWRGRGFATRAALLLSRWALRQAGLARLAAGTAPDNAASARVLAKAGFRREGLRQGYLPRPDGGRADVVAHALLATDLPAVTAPG
jgi:RimJ/RimL family protein N-acetyltransferase